MLASISQIKRTAKNDRGKIPLGVQPSGVLATLGYMEHGDMTQLREQHPAWRLLRASSAPLVLSFLGAFFVEENRGAVPASRLIDALDDHLHVIREHDADAYPREPASYLDDWAAPERGWLRKFYPVGAEEVYFDATPAVEKAYRFVQGLQQRSFVGTESRLHTLVELLRQIVHGSELDPEARITELERRRLEIDEQIQAVQENRAALLDETAVRDRYQLFSSTARELLSDFREVEENFRSLDRSAREKITAWDGGRGELLAVLVAGRSDISTSDQGRSFQAFYDFLLSEQRQQELAGLVKSVQDMPVVIADHRLRYIHHDWAEAAERTQQTVRNLSEQLRRFLEDQVWVENRRVLDIVKTIEQSALKVRDSPPADLGLLIDEPGLSINLPFERPLYTVQSQTRVNSIIEPVADEVVEFDALLGQRFVDAARLAGNIRAIVPPRSSASLGDIIALFPIEEGVAEILGYLALSEDDISVELNDTEVVVIGYSDLEGRPKRATMPKVTVTRR